MESYTKPDITWFSLDLRWHLNCYIAVLTAQSSPFTFKYHWFVYIWSTLNTCYIERILLAARTHKEQTCKIKCDIGMWMNERQQTLTMYNMKSREIYFSYRIYFYLSTKQRYVDTYSSNRSMIVIRKIMNHLLNTMPSTFL